MKTGVTNQNLQIRARASIVANNIMKDIDLALQTLDASSKFVTKVIIEGDSTVLEYPNGSLTINTSGIILHTATDIQQLAWTQSNVLSALNVVHSRIKYDYITETFRLVI